MIRIFQYGEVPNETLFIRSPLIQDVSGTVKDILADVREHGDEALYRLTERFDGAKLSSLLVSDEEIEEAFEAVSEEYRKVLRLAHDNIAEYHRQQILLTQQAAKDPDIVEKIKGQLRKGGDVIVTTGLPA